MRYAGIGWDATGYQVEVLDGAGERVAAPARFPSTRVAALVDHVHRHAPGGVAVVDSTNGSVDGQLMAAGLAVHRADPPLLGDRPLLGSVPAADLARAALRRPEALGRLERHRGTQTGREPELERWARQAGPAQEALAGDRRWIRHGPRDRPQVALTFDDGPQPPWTGRVLDVLERYGVPATFFCIGLHAATRRDEVDRIREQGHALGNHTWSHPFLPELTRDQQVEQDTRTGDALAGAGGDGRHAWFRPPYGSRSPDVVRWLAATPAAVVLWDVESADWSIPGADAIAERTRAQVRPG